MVSKAVIPAAGIGTGLLPITKEIPKEMLPIILKHKNSYIVKPILQIVFESLYNVGFRNYCIIVGRGKRAIEDYFTPDPRFIGQIKQLKVNFLIDDVLDFYKKISSSMIVYINQPKPRGLGDAILRVKKFVKEEDFIVHAGDTFISNRSTWILKDLVERFLNLNADVLILTTYAKKGKRYRHFVKIEKDCDSNVVKGIFEDENKSNIVLVHIYVFSNRIFDILERMKDKRVIKITDAINELIKQNGRVFAYVLDKDVVDINVPEIYLDVLKSFSLKDY